MKQLLYFDCETTGLDPQRNDIIQMAFILEDSGQVIAEKTFTCQPFSMENVSPQALAVNGITREQLKSFPDPRAVYKEVTMFLGMNRRLTLTGYNVQFDCGFLKAWLEKCNGIPFSKIFNYKSLDVYALVLAEYYKHDAMEDIKATRVLFHKLLGV